MEREITTQGAKDAGRQQMMFSAASSLPHESMLRSRGVPVPSSDRSALKITYDVSSSLPTRMDFADLLGSDDAWKIETYVLFSDYRTEQGVMIPHHIERYIQRTLESDIRISGVSTR